MRVTEADLATTSTQEEYILTLAHVDQGRLWDVAWKVKDREDRLNDVAEAAGSSAHDAEAYEEIERRHRDFFEAAQAEHERFRHIWFMVGGIFAISVAPAAMVGGINWRSPSWSPRSARRSRRWCSGTDSIPPAGTSKKR